jgi:hypothetical protein
MATVVSVHFAHLPLVSNGFDQAMDNNVALQRVVQGGSVLLLDVPEGCVVGIDTKRFLVGKNFAGLKMIPPGLHYIFFRYASYPNRVFRIEQSM